MYEMCIKPCNVISQACDNHAWIIKSTQPKQHLSRIKKTVLSIRQDNPYNVMLCTIWYENTWTEKVIYTGTFMYKGKNSRRNYDQRNMYSYAHHRCHMQLKID